jgi:hypothetical protein
VGGWGELMYMKVKVVHNILVRQPSETVQNIKWLPERNEL